MTRSMMLFVGVIAYLAWGQVTALQQTFQKTLSYPGGLMQAKVGKVAIFEEVKPLKLNNREKECLARNVYYEAGTEKTLGKIAVAQVTLNRVQTGYWGHHICDVVYAPDQFSWTKDEDRVNAQPKGELWKESLIAVSTVIDNGVRIRQMKKALFYHADYVHPDWRDNNKMIGQIGTHIFYWGGKDSWLEL